MAAISQTTQSKFFSRMKMLEFRFKFHWSSFLRVQLTIFRNGQRHEIICDHGDTSRQRLSEKNVKLTNLPQPSQTCRTSTLWREIAWDMCFGHIIYTYLKYNEPSHIWPTNTLNMTNQPTGGAGLPVLLFILLLISPWLQTILYLIPYHVLKYLYSNYTHTKTVELDPFF